MFYRLFVRHFDIIANGTVVKWTKGKGLMFLTENIH